MREVPPRSQGSASWQPRSKEDVKRDRRRRGLGLMERGRRRGVGLAVAFAHLWKRKRQFFVERRRNVNHVEVVACICTVRVWSLAGKVHVGQVLKVPQQEFCPWEPPHFECFFQIWRRSIFFKMSKKRSIYESFLDYCFYPQLRRRQNFFFRFWRFSTKILVTGWPNFTQFLASILPTTFILWFFSLTRKKYF